MRLVLKEHIVQPKHCQHTFFVLMAHILMQRARVIVNCVIVGSDAPVLEWKLLKHVPMEHTATQLVLGIVFYAQQVIGEVL